MTRQVMEYEINKDGDVIRISQPNSENEEHFIVITLYQVDFFCQTLREERDELKKQT